MDSPTSFARSHLLTFNAVNTFSTPLIICYIWSINSDTHTHTHTFRFDSTANCKWKIFERFDHRVHCSSAFTTWEDFHTHTKEKNCDEEINQPKTHKSKYIWRCIHRTAGRTCDFGLVKIHKAQHHRHGMEPRNSYDNNQQINSHEHVYLTHSYQIDVPIDRIEWAELHFNANSIDHNHNLLLDHKNFY